MTTFTPNHSTLDERTRKAWSAYREALADLHGRAYDTAESGSWDQLQDALRDIEAERAALHTGGEREG